MDNLKVPPHNLESEQSLLGGIFIDPGIIKNLTLADTDFYREAHRLLYRTMIEMDNDGIIIEPTTLYNELQERGFDEKTGGMDYLFTLSECVSTSVSAPYHENVVRELSVKRKIIIFTQATREAVSNGGQVNEIINNIKDFAGNLNLLNSGETTLSQDVLSYIEQSSGIFLSSDVVRCLHLKTRQDQKNLSKIFSRLISQGLIERAGRTNGCFRKINEDFEVVTLNEIPDEANFDLRLPLSIQKYIDIMPKDLIVFAGVPNSGKTAIMLETLRLNMGRFDCYYFSSEMGRHNCKKRLAKHTDTKDWPFKFIDDFADFVDVIQPDDLNFLDYIEEHEGEAYRIPGILGKIQKKLKKGVAVIALQKNPDKTYAVGGHQTKAKPALYCTIDPDYPGAIMRIVKAKNYKDENPNGYMQKFKIVQGINILPGHWEPES